MTKALSKSAIAKLIKQHEDKVVSGVVADILSQADRASAIEKTGNNVELRKAALRKALAENNKVALDEVEEALGMLVPLGQVLAAESESVMENGFDDENVVTAMTAYLKGKMVAETQSALQDLVKSMVFRAMDIAFADEEFPEHTNGEIHVPELGKKFCREGAGRKDPEFDMKKLAELVGPEMFSAITVEKVVVTREVDENALSVAVLANPELMEQLRDAVAPGGWKSARLMVRDIPANEKE